MIAPFDADKIVVLVHVLEDERLAAITAEQGLLRLRSHECDGHRGRMHQHERLLPRKVHHNTTNVRHDG